MARNVKHAGKVDGGSAIHRQENGPVFTGNRTHINDTRSDKGKFHGKTPVNGVEHGSPHGATFTENSTHIPTMNADKPPKGSKLMGEKGGLFKPTDTACDKTASKAGSGGPEDRPYPLAKSYDKKGREVSKEPKKVF